MALEITQIENFITEQQEKEIIKLVPIKEKTGDKRNQVLRFGNPIPYTLEMYSREIPEIFNTLNIPITFDSVTINEYYEGQQLDYHIDLPYSGNKIYILTLLSNGNLKFKNKTGKELQFNLKQRSLSILEGELRWNWQHSMKADKKRYSIVFRNSLDKIPSHYFCNICESYHINNNKNCLI
jgi:alkylated DNA repair dioxygenase AlkB